MGRTEVDRHGRKRCHRCQLPFSWISSSRHKERFTRWDGSLGPSRKRFLSRGIVVVYSFIGNGNSKFPPGGIFSDSPPDLGPIFFSPVIVYRSDDNLIPIQFCRRWCRFRRISVRNYRERRRGKAYLHSGVSRHVAWKRRARFIQHVEFHRSRLVSSDFADDDDVNYTDGLYTIYPPVDKELRILAPFLPRPSFLLPTFYQLPRTRSWFSFRREHGTEPAIIYPERPVFFRGSKIETDEKPYFREHAAHRRLPIIGKLSSPQLLSDNLSIDEALITRCRAMAFRSSCGVTRFHVSRTFTDSCRGMASYRGGYFDIRIDRKKERKPGMVTWLGLNRHRGNERAGIPERNECRSVPFPLPHPPSSRFQIPFLIRVLCHRIYAHFDIRIGLKEGRLVPADKNPSPFGFFERAIHSFRSYNS